MRYFNFIAFIIVLVIGLIGCESATDADSPPCEVFINSDNVDIEIGSATTISAEVNEERSTQEINWESSNPDIASVDNNGKVTGEKLEIQQLKLVSQAIIPTNVTALK